MSEKWNLQGIQHLRESIDTGLPDSALDIIEAVVDGSAQIFPGPPTRSALVYAVVISKVKPTCPECGGLGMMMACPTCHGSGKEDD